MVLKNKPLSKKDIDKKMLGLIGWTLSPKLNQISKTYTFPSFITALAFCAKITVHAEVLSHHPDLELSYGKVKVKLTTHDIKGLSKNDFELAKRIDNLKVN